MNLLLHGLKDIDFELYHGDSLTNDWDMLRETNPTKKFNFDAVISFPPYFYQWDSDPMLSKDIRFVNYEFNPKSSQDFAFLLHGFHYLKENRVMAIIMSQRTMFRNKVVTKIHRKLINDGHVDTIIGLPANIFYSTGAPFYIVVLKNRRKSNDVLFINASEHFKRDRRKNYLSDQHIKKIIDTYRERPEYVARYARRVKKEEIEANDFELIISRYVNTDELDMA